MSRYSIEHGSARESGLPEHPDNIEDLHSFLRMHQRGTVTSLAPKDIGAIPNQEQFEPFLAGQSYECLNGSQSDLLYSMVQPALDDARSFYRLQPDEEMPFRMVGAAGHFHSDRLRTHEPHVDSYLEAWQTDVNEVKKVPVAGLLYLGNIAGAKTEWRPGEIDTSDDDYYSAAREWDPAEPLPYGHFGRGYLELSIHNSPAPDRLPRGFISVVVPVPRSRRTAAEPILNGYGAVSPVWF